MKSLHQNYNGIKEILWDKRPNIVEIELTLFENCDVNCSFCGHTKDAIVGMKLEEMLAKLPLVDEFLDTIDRDIKMVNLHLLGGELFQDRLITEEHNILNDYKILLRGYADICSKRSLEPRIIFVTNNLTGKPNKVIEFLEEVKKFAKVSLIISYDLTGRPITAQYKKNIDNFKEYISNVNMVATKTTIQKLMNGGTELFQYLYCNFPIYMDDFLPDKTSEHLIPSDAELLEFMKYCLDKFPNIMPYCESVRAIKGNTKDIVAISGSTFNKCTIIPNGTKTNYVWDRHNEDSFRYPLDYSDNTNMLFNFVMESGCLSCQYYESCHFRCPVLWSWENRERMDTCVNKAFFDFVKTHN